MRKVLVFTGLVLVSLLSFSQCLKNNCESGYGVYKGANFVYKGNFEEGEFNGNGELEIGDEKWLGYFQKGKRNGFFEFYRNNKLVYKGEFSNNNFNGRGTYFYKDLKDQNGNIVATGDIEWTGQFDNGSQQEGSFNFETTYKKENIISKLDNFSLDLTRERGHFIIPISFVSNHEKYYLLDTGCSDIFLSLEDFIDLKKKGLAFKKTNIKTYAQIANGSTQEAKIYEVYNIKIKDVLIKKIHVAVATKRNATTLIGMQFFDMFYNYNLPNKNGQMMLFFE
tara:strand:+ start:5210 stop:6049 length:840 start_codon:yes stop_codon:yes gene_type:complete